MGLDPQTIDLVKNLALLAIFLLVALTLATRFGFIYCGQIPGWCDAYHVIMRLVLNRNYPAVLIVYGDDGMGDPGKLHDYIRQVCRIYVRKAPITRVGPGNLSRYDVVVVEHAKTLSAEQLEMLWDFVASGGKLVFVGDSGTDDDRNGATFYAENNVVNPWDRVKPDGTVILFGSELLGLRFKDVVSGYAGKVSVEDDPLTAAIPEDVHFSGSYARVEIMGTSVFGPQAVVMTAGSDPLIVRVGYRIVYFAFPPESALGQESVQMAFLVRNLCDWMGT